MTSLHLSHLNHAPASETPNELRLKKIKTVLWVILFANLVIALVKYVYGTSVGLVSMKADGIHSGTDGASNIIGLLALRLASNPPDSSHPYGHRKYEVAAAMGIGIAILFGISEIARSILLGLSTPAPAHVGNEAYAIALGTLGVNILVAGLEAQAGKRLSSMILAADARHTLSDSLATVVVLAGMVLGRWGVPFADVGSACVVVVLIACAAWPIFRTGLTTLLDEAQLPSQEIRRIVLETPQVLGCHAIRSRGQPDFVFIDLHIQLSPEMTIRQGHEVAHAVARRLHGSFPSVAEALVHIEPADDDDQLEFEREPAVD